MVKGINSANTWVKGLNYIPTLGANSRSAPRNRAEGLTELAHREHEKARLERRRQMQAGCQARIEGQLDQVQQRIDLLTQVLYDKCSDQPRARVASGTGRETPEPPVRRATSLEY